MGDAVLFFNHSLTTGALDPASVHAGLPVGTKFVNVDVNKKESGVEKWVANYWLGIDSFD